MQQHYLLTLTTVPFSLKQEEYLRAYYAAMYAASQQNASQAAAAAAPIEMSTETSAEGTSADVVKKEVEDDDDVEWEEPGTSLIFMYILSVRITETTCSNLTRS